MTLGFKEQKTGSIVAGISLRFRLAMACIALITLATGFVEFGTGGFSLGTSGLLLTIVVILGALYEEKWTIEPANSTVSLRLGLIFVAKTTSWKFADIERVALERFLKGRNPGAKEEPQSQGLAELGKSSFMSRLFAPKPYHRIALYTKTGDTLVIETKKAKEGDGFAQWAEKITDMVGAGN